MRGASQALSAALQNFQSANGVNSQAISGFTPSAATVGAVIIMVSRTSSGAGVLDITSPPAGWVVEAEQITTWTQGSFAVLSRMSGYAGGAQTVGFASFTANLPEIGIMLEFQ